MDISETAGGEEACGCHIDRMRGNTLAKPLSTLVASIRHRLFL